MGRVRKAPDERLSPALRDEILEVVRRTGCEPRVAAARCGVSPKSWDAWERIARDEDEAFYEPFMREVEQAQAGVESMLVERIIRAGAEAQEDEEVITTTTTDPDGQVTIREVRRKRVVRAPWQANAWLLERSRPERYARTQRQQLEVTGKDGGAIEHTDTVRDAERLEQLHRELGRLAPLGGAPGGPGDGGPEAGPGVGGGPGDGVAVLGSSEAAPPAG